jgi:hypothetical protein
VQPDLQSRPVTFEVRSKAEGDFMAIEFNPLDPVSIADYYQYNPSDFNRYAVVQALTAFANNGQPQYLNAYLAWLQNTDDEYSTPS